MSDSKTHREQKPPQISARILADYMAASQISQRSIIASAKYRSTAHVIKQNDAKLPVAKLLRRETSLEWLTQEADRIRNKVTDDDFDETLNKVNDDYIEHFSRVFRSLILPNGDITASGLMPPLIHAGLRITAASDIRVRIRHVNRKNKLKVGAAVVRYAKGKSLSGAVAQWQSAFVHGYLARTSIEEGTELDLKLCVTIDAHAGKCWSAPTNSIARFKQMMAACASIAERWPNIQPPKGAVL